MKLEPQVFTKMPVKLKEGEKNNRDKKVCVVCSKHFDNSRPEEA